MSQQSTVRGQKDFSKSWDFFEIEKSILILRRSKTFLSRRVGVAISFLLLAAYCLLLPATASAHRVNVYGYAEDGKVFVEGYFVDGTKAMNSLVEVFDAETGEKLLEGKTNKEGVFSFKIPKLTALKLVLTASMGHKNDYTISREEVAEALGRSGTSQESTVRSQQSPVSSEQSEASKQRAGQKEEVTAEGAVSSKEIEQVVAKVLDRKLLPIKNILLKMQEEASRPGMTEIIGGIGYIMGIMGIVLYFKSKNR
ncbi:MAG: hypothetical protein GXO97_06790 [Nitrospirae bacterium]|nr:hypothetical protein [Nitrospirota bacterium]